MQGSSNWIRHEIISSESNSFSGFLNALQNLPISGVQETRHSLIIFYEDNSVEVSIKTLCYLLGLDVKHKVDFEKQRNWNAEWESSFQPVSVDDFCVIFAHFHSIDPNEFEYKIQITPQMSFGTGHHETTRLMINHMRKLNFENKSVLDFGTGTGILAILSEMMGSKNIIGIDNMPWAVENAVENAKVNQCDRIEFIHGNDARVPEKKFDLVLVNIIRKVIFDNLDTLQNQTKPGGYLLLSGYLRNDAQKMIFEARRRGFDLIEETTDNKWVSQLFQKSINA